MFIDSLNGCFGTDDPTAGVSGCSLQALPTAVSAFCDFCVSKFSSQPTTFTGFHTAPLTMKLTSGEDPGPGCPVLLGKRRQNSEVMCHRSLTLTISFNTEIV